MRKLLAFALVLCVAFAIAFVGCGPSAREVAERKVAEGKSLAWRHSRKLANGEVGKDGWLVRQTEVVPMDPWGNQMRVEYRRSGALERVYVQSNGPDGLPGTKDDIGQVGTHINRVEMERMDKEREEHIRGGFGAAARGVVEGVRKGMSDPTKGPDGRR